MVEGPAAKGCLRQLGLPNEHYGVCRSAGGQKGAREVMGGNRRPLFLYRPDQEGRQEKTSSLKLLRVQRLTSRLRGVQTAAPGYY